MSTVIAMRKRERERNQNQLVIQYFLKQIIQQTDKMAQGKGRFLYL